MLLKSFVLLFLGGGTGSVLRYSVQLLLAHRALSYGFPWSTFAVNLFGSFLLGLFYALSTRLPLSPDTRLMLTTGLCGGFTTFSTFCIENLQLLRQGCYTLFLLYTLLSVTLGIVAAFVGAALGR